MARRQIGILIFLVFAAAGCSGSSDGNGATDPQQGGAATATSTATNSSASMNYGLFFNLPASMLLTGQLGARPLNFGPEQHFTASDGCNVTYQSDGEISCYTNSSCPADASVIPLCVFIFSGSQGLTAEAIVSLVPLSAPTSTPTTTTNYGLLFSPSASKLLTGSRPLNLGAAHFFTDNNSCNVTVQDDGLIECFVDSSCPADASKLPRCALVFSAPKNLTLV